MVILNIQQIIIELFASNNISYIFKERSCFFMKKLQDYKFWFIVGSQFLYGPEALKAVEEDAKKMVEGLNASGKLPAKIEFKAVGTTAEVIDRFVMDAMMILVLVLSHGCILSPHLKCGLEVLKNYKNHIFTFIHNTIEKFQMKKSIWIS